MTDLVYFQKELADTLAEFAQALALREQYKENVELVSVIHDAEVRRFQRAIEALFRVFEVYVKEKYNVSIESIEQLFDVLVQNLILTEQEREAAGELIEVCQFLIEARPEDNEQVAEVMDYLPTYHQALGIFALKINALTVL